MPPPQRRGSGHQIITKIDNRFHHSDTFGIFLHRLTVSYKVIVPRRNYNVLRHLFGKAHSAAIAFEVFPYPRTHTARSAYIKQEERVLCLFFGCTDNGYIIACLIFVGLLLKSKMKKLGCIEKLNGFLDYIAAKSR